MATALVVDSNLARRIPTTEALEAAGFGNVIAARSSGEGMLMARRLQPDVAVIGQHIEAEDAGCKLLAELERAGVYCILTADLSEVPQGAISSNDYDAISSRARAYRDSACRSAPAIHDVQWDFVSVPTFQELRFDP